MLITLLKRIFGRFLKRHILGGKALHTLIKVFTVLVIIFIISLYFHLRPQNDSDILTGENYSKPPKIDNQNNIKQDGNEKELKRPKDGVSTLIGKTSKQLIDKYGEPNRKDPSAYDYEWWIYNQDDDNYIQVGIEDGKVATIFVIGDKVEVMPFKIGQDIQEIYQSILLDTDIIVDYDEGTYQFELSEEDLNIRPLVQLGSIYAQLSFDKFKGTLSSVRFMDKKTLIKQRPYEMVYRGKLINPQEIDETRWRAIEEGSEQQIFDLTNIIRERFKLNKLEWDGQTAEVAYHHSEDMFVENYFSHESPKYGDLAKRLESADVFYQLAGENIAAKYMDGPAAVEGWLNSEGHRKSLLEKKFTHLGVGVYRNYFTQNFIEKSWQ